MPDTTPLNTLIAQPYQLATTYTATLTDASHAGTAIVFNPSGALWYRTFLAQSTGTGADDTTPIGLLAHVRSVLGALWTVTLTVACKIAITYIGTGTGTIAWGSSAGNAQGIARLLGFTSDIGPLATNATATAQNAPYFCVFTFCREKDTPWRPRFAHFAGAVSGSGRPDVMTSGYQILKRSFTLGWHPATPTIAAANGFSPTPYFPDDVNDVQWLTPSGAVPTTSTQPWTLHQFLSTAYNLTLGCALGNLQDLISGASHLYSAAWLDPKTAEGEPAYSSANLSQRLHRPGVVLNLFERELIP